MECSPEGDLHRAIAMGRHLIQLCRNYHLAKNARGLAHFALGPPTEETLQAMAAKIVVALPEAESLLQPLLPRIDRANGQVIEFCGMRERSRAALILRSAKWLVLTAGLPIPSIQPALGDPEAFVRMIVEGHAPELPGDSASWDLFADQFEAEIGLVQSTAPRNDQEAEESPDQADGMNATQQRALEIIRASGPIQGKVLAKRLKIAPDTLRRHVLPALRSFGVRNDRNGEGYYMAPHRAT